MPPPSLPKFDLTTPPRIRYQNGQSEQLAFRVLSISDRQKYIKLLEERDTVGIVAFCAGQNAQWIDMLTEECFDDLANWCFIANFQWVMGRASRDPITSTMVHPFAAAMDRVVQSITSASLDTSSSSPIAALGSASGSSSPTEPAPAVTEVPTTAGA